MMNNLENPNVDYSLWQAYHSDDLIDVYNLRNTEDIIIYNTSSMTYPGKSLNYLHKFLCEGTMLLYPYLNNLSSRFIGFMHYRRVFNTTYGKIPIKLLAQGYFQYFHYHNPIDEIKKHREEYGIDGFDYKTPYKNIENHCFFWSVDKCGIMGDMIEFMSTQYPEYLEKEKELHEMIWACTFVASWESYCGLAKFIYDYISFINDKYKLYWNEDLWKKHVYHKFMLYNQTHHPKPKGNKVTRIEEGDGSVWCELPFWGEKGWTNCSYENGYNTSINTHNNLYRVYSYMIEFLTSVYIYNHYHYLDHNNVLCFISKSGDKNPIPFDDEEYRK